MTEYESLNYIRENLNDRARLMQLGEECAELSVAIFKLFRKNETDNPTPKSHEEVHENLIEEIEDVVLSISVISEYLRDKKIYEAKLKRWVERLKEREENDEVDILQTLLFTVIRNNTIMPVGLRLGKDMTEINRMSYAAMLEFRNMIDIDRAYAAFLEGKERYWKEKRMPEKRYIRDDLDNFCPNCGAKMDKE